MRGRMMRGLAAPCDQAAAADPAPRVVDDEGAAEAQALAAAIAESDAAPRTARHEDVRPWLLRRATGEFDAPPPIRTKLCPSSGAPSK
jgi:hypothetical protein